MPSIKTPENFHGLGHTPPYVKETEIGTPYNPFFYELKYLRGLIVPEWLEVPGITINWLLEEGPPAEVFIGIDAETAGGFLEFANRFAVGHSLTAIDAERLVLLGHPTIAHYGPGPSDSDKASPEGIRSYVGNLGNYMGVIGGELKWSGSSWRINDASGRYGSQRLPGDRPQQREWRDRFFQIVREEFRSKAGMDVN